MKTNQHDDKPSAFRLLSRSRAKDSGSSQGMIVRDRLCPAVFGDCSTPASWSKTLSRSPSASGKLSNTLRWNRRCTSIHDTASGMHNSQVKVAFNYFIWFFIWFRACFWPSEQWWNSCCLTTFQHDGPLFCLLGELITCHTGDKCIMDISTCRGLKSGETLKQE